MAQHDYQLADALGAEFRADLNAALAAMASNNLGAAVPPRILPGMLWLDTRLPAQALQLRNAQDSDWLPVAVGAGFLPLAGGTISGNLAVAGIFRNPGFEAMRVSHAGTTAPLTNLVAGMLWYDTTTTAGKLKILAPDLTTWLDVLDLSSPVFTNTITVDSVAGNAQLNLTAAAERRRIVANQAALRFDFYGPADQLTASLSDAGDLYVPTVGWVLSVIAGKQANLGYTPVRQYDAAVVQVGGVPAHLYIDGADRGAINTSSTVVLLPRNAIGQYAMLQQDGGPVGFNALTSGSTLRYYLRPGTGDSAPGTWRNMDAPLSTGLQAFFQRVA